MPRFNLGQLNEGLDVRIGTLETIPLRIPLRQTRQMSHGGARSELEVLLVCLHTDAGPVGVGETQAWRRQGNSETLAGLAAQIRDHFTPHLIGRSPFELAGIMHELDKCMHHSLYAKAAVADALYDLQGKLLGVPVYALLGGRCRQAVNVTGVLYIHSSPEAVVADAEPLFEQGVRSFALKVGLDPEADIRNVRALRERFGDEAVLRIDANAGMDFDGALNLLRRLAPYDIEAAEQLLPLWDLAGMAELARRTQIPFIADESVASEHDLMNVFRTGAASAVQTKIAKNGGIRGCLKLWQIAAAAGMRINPGNHPSTSIATMAAAHLATAWPGALMDGAFACGIDALESDVVTEPVTIQGNAVRVLDAPGLGVTLDRSQIRQWRVDR